MEDRNGLSAYRALRLAYGLIPVAAGLDKFTNLLVDWEKYLSPLALRLLPVSPAAFMGAVGIVEIAVGGAILAGFARVAGFVAAGWLLAIALNLVASGAYLDVAAREVGIAVGAYALGRLAQAHEHVAERAPRVGEARAHA
jgi:uncharacterized membrane protein YphA (DoxX/SURF4 family)